MGHSKIPSWKFISARRAPIVLFFTLNSQAIFLIENLSQNLNSLFCFGDREENPYLPIRLFTRAHFKAEQNFPSKKIRMKTYFLTDNPLKKLPKKHPECFTHDCPKYFPFIERSVSFKCLILQESSLLSPRQDINPAF